MRRLKTYQNHSCCPADWKTTQDLTGSYELDAVILKSPNKDMAQRIEDHLMCDQAYQKRTAYNGSSID